MNKPRELDAALLADLQALLGDRVTTSRGVRDHHGKDESVLPLRAARRGGVPAIDRGGARHRARLPRATTRR